MDKNLDHNRANYLKRNTLLFAIGNFGAKIISFFLVPLYTYTLSSAEYGVIDIIGSMVTITVPIITLNIAEAVLRFSQDKDAPYDKIVGLGLLSLLISLMCMCLIVPVLHSIELLSPYVWYICGYVLSLASNQMFMGFLRGREYLLQYSLGNIIHAVLVAVLNILFVAVWNGGVKGYVLAYVISNSVVAVYAFFAGRIWNLLKRFVWDSSFFQHMLHYSVLLIPSSLLWWVVNSSNRILISMFLDEGAVGIYAISCKIPTLISSVASVFTVAWSYSAIKENTSTDREEYTNRVYQQFLAVALIAGTGVLMVLKPFMKIYVSAEYYQAWEYVPLILLGTVASLAGSFLATAYTVYKDSMGFLKSAIVGAITSVAVNLFFIPRIGIQGAAFATCTGHIMVLLFRAIDTRKYIKIPVFDRRNALAIFIMLLMAITIYIEGLLGQIMLIVEWACVVCLLRDHWINIIRAVLKKGNVNE